MHGFMQESWSVSFFLGACIINRFTIAISTRVRISLLEKGSDFCVVVNSGGVK